MHILLSVANVFAAIAEYVIAPLFVLGVSALVALIYRDNKARKKLVQDVKDDLERFKKYLIGDDRYRDDRGKIGDIEDALKTLNTKVDTIVNQTK